MIVSDIGAAQTSATSVSVTVPAGGVPAGSLIYVVVGDSSGSLVTTGVSDTAGNAYTLINSNGGSGQFYCPNCLALASGNTVKYTRGTSVSIGISTCFATSVAQTSPLDTGVSAVATGTSSTPSVTPGNPLNTGQLLYFGGLVHTGGTATNNSGWASPPDIVAGTTGLVGGGNQILTAKPTSYAPGLSASATWVAMISAFKPGIVVNNPLKVYKRR